jgi:hypothetical protein
MLNPARPKRPRLPLDSEPYNQRLQEILRRGGWRCQLCGTRSNLEVHHQEFRSHCGDDSEPNLITSTKLIFADYRRTMPGKR